MKSSQPGTKISEINQAMNGHPTSSYYVSHDCTAESPTGREPYGDGGSIVVGGVTTTQGGWESQPQGKGSQESGLSEEARYA